LCPSDLPKRAVTNYATYVTYLGAWERVERGRVVSERVHRYDLVLCYVREGVLCVLGARRREAPSGEACGSSRRGELRGRPGRVRLSRSLQRSVNRWSQHNEPAGCEDTAAR